VRLPERQLTAARAESKLEGCGHGVGLAPGLAAVGGTRRRPERLDV
jgi:hypothetical protein